jgi:hypothetical protein
MSYAWTCNSINNRLFLEASDPQGHRLTVCALIPEQSQTHYLMPVRIFDSYEPVGNQRDALFARRIEAQTDGLQEKIRSVDRLRLSDVSFSERIVAARMIISSPDAQAAQTIWDFARQAMRELENHLPLPVVSQIDYDQKRMHSSLGSILESIDFAVRHDPSAIATTIAFEKLLASAGIPIDELKVSVTGVGDLGSRLVKRFLEAGAQTVYVLDQNLERLRRVAELPNVEVLENKDLIDSGCQAHVLSADKSFSDELALTWATADSVVVVGGPEAGMDRFENARRKLNEAGKQYIPSVLCGSLGLVSNLEESIGIIPNLDQMTSRYTYLLDKLIEHMRGGQSLSSVCEDVLNGKLHIIPAS